MVFFFFHLQRQAYLIASGVISIIYVLSAAVLFLGVKEKKGKKTLLKFFTLQQHKVNIYYLVCS